MQTKAEQDQWLAEIEAGGGTEGYFGKGSVLLIPKPERVIKATILPSGAKLFINLCSSLRYGHARMRVAIRLWLA